MIPILCERTQSKTRSSRSCLLSHIVLDRCVSSRNGVYDRFLVEFSLPSLGDGVLESISQSVLLHIL